MPLVWVAETAGIIASASLLIALAVILVIYDDKAVFDWKGVTLNTVVSVLSTASKAALLYTTSELISQWKWIVFTSTRRSLIDFQRIDTASRGPLGSSEIIWRPRAIGWLRLGALVVVLSIAADPLNQQLIQYKQRVVYSEDTSTTITIAGRYAKGRRTFLPAMFLDWAANVPCNISSAILDTDLSMQSAILYGIDQPMESVFHQGNFNCPTGNCTWPPLESLSVCNRCTDVTARLERIVSGAVQYVPLIKRPPLDADNEVQGSGTAFRLPNGLHLDNANGWMYDTTDTNVTSEMTIKPGAVIMTALGTANASETISAYDLDTLIWSMSMIRVRPDATTVVWPDLPLSAMECALFYCVNNYEFKVSNGALTVTNEQVPDVNRAANSWDVEGWGGGLNESTLESIAFKEPYSSVQRTDLTLVSPASRRRFNISQSAIDSISYYYQTTFASEYYEFNISDSKTGRLNGFYILENSQIQYEPSIMQALFGSHDLNATFTTLAASMSNAIRTGSDEIFDGVPNVVTGSKGELTTFYRVAWPWISLHLFIVVTGFVFLVLTIRENKRHGWAVPMWKSSSLAVLNRGQEVTGILSGMQTLEQMEARSKTSQVMLFDKGAKGSWLEHLDFDPLEIES